MKHNLFSLSFIGVLTIARYPTISHGLQKNSVVQAPSLDWRQEDTIHPRSLVEERPWLQRRKVTVTQLGKTSVGKTPQNENSKGAQLKKTSSTGIKSPRNSVSLKRSKSASFDSVKSSSPKSSSSALSRQRSAPSSVDSKLISKSTTTVSSQKQNQPKRYRYTLNRELVRQSSAPDRMQYNVPPQRPNVIHPDRKTTSVSELAKKQAKLAPVKQSPESTPKTASKVSSGRPSLQNTPRTQRGGIQHHVSFESKFSPHGTPRMQQSAPAIQQIGPSGRQSPSETPRLQQTVPEMHPLVLKDDPRKYDIPHRPGNIRTRKSSFRDSSRRRLSNVDYSDHGNPLYDRKNNSPGQSPQRQGSPSQRDKRGGGRPSDVQISRPSNLGTSKRSMQDPRDPYRTPGRTPFRTPYQPSFRHYDPSILRSTRKTFEIERPPTPKLSSSGWNVWDMMKKRPQTTLNMVNTGAVAATVVGIGTGHVPLTIGGVAVSAIATGANSAVSAKEESRLQGEARRKEDHAYREYRELQEAEWEQHSMRGYEKRDLGSDLGEDIY